MRIRLRPRRFLVAAVFIFFLVSQLSAQREVTWDTQPNGLAPSGLDIGVRMQVECPGNGALSGRLWGTDFYTDDSSICTAAVHAGKITVQGGGLVTFEVRGDAAPYKGSVRNGVQSRDYGTWGRSFTFSRSSDKPPAPAIDIRLRAETHEVNSGEAVTVPIWLDNASRIANMNFTVLYDVSVVRAGSVSEGGVLPSRSLFEANSAEAGVVRVGVADSRDFGGSGPIAEIQFDAVGRPGSRTALRLGVSEISGADGDQPLIQTIDGSIEVVGAKGPLPGDANGNGSLDAGDALDALKMSVKLIPAKVVCDIDNDGHVTSTDARLILQKVVGRTS